MRVPPGSRVTTTLRPCASSDSYRSFTWVDLPAPFDAFEREEQTAPRAARDRPGSELRAELKAADPTANLPDQLRGTHRPDREQRRRR